MMSEIVKRATRADEKALLQSLIEEMQAFRTTTTEFAARYFGNVVNKVLLVETITFDASGYVFRQFQATAGCVEVRNLDATNAVTISSGGPSAGSIPLNGVGLFVIPGGKVQVVNINSTDFTLYGTTASRVSVQVFVDGGRNGGS
jgi:hypothetical protein